MTLSLITPTYNSARTIRDTLNSIAGQTFQDREYIIIDGGSHDGTLDIIKEYQTRLPIRLISEADQGLYDAMNKGVKLASGEIIGILNSDDFYKDDRVLQKVTECFQANPDIDACYGDLEFVDARDVKKVVRFWRAGEYRETKLNNGWTIPHPTFFVKRSVYQKFGAFRPEFRLAGDYELLLRLLKIHNLSVKYLPEVLTCMRVGGASGRDFSQRQRGWRELKLAWRINGLKIPPFFILRRVIFKLHQYL